MRFQIVAVGRLKRGPEAQLIDDYLDRFSKTGRALGLGPVEIREVENRNGSDPSAEARLIRRAVPEGAVRVALDERGEVITSPALADHFARWRDEGRRDLAIVIGGANGLDPGLRDEADFVLSFGAMVWPHMLARVMLAEQLYRAATILAGGPYHRA